MIVTKSFNVGKTTITHPPVITIFGTTRENTLFPVHYCLTTYPKHIPSYSLIEAIATDMFHDSIAVKLISRSKSPDLTLSAPPHGSLAARPESWSTGWARDIEGHSGVRVAW